MTQVRIKSEDRQLSGRDISDLEARLGLSIPSSLKEFLLAHNGGRPHPDSFSVPGFGVDSQSAINWFLGVDTRIQSSSIEWNFRTLLGRIPADLIPIAVASLGDILCLSIGEKTPGAIYLWDHEDEHLPPTYKNVYKCADSLDEFLKNLHEIKFSWVTEFDEAITQDDANRLKDLLTESPSELENEDQWGRTLIERSAIGNATRCITYLFEQGAQLRNSLKLAEQNAAFFPDHKKSVDVIRRLAQLR